MLKILTEEFDLGLRHLRILQNASAVSILAEELVPIKRCNGRYLGAVGVEGGGFCDDHCRALEEAFSLWQEGKRSSSIAVVGISSRVVMLALGAREAERYRPGTDTTDFLNSVGHLSSAPPVDAEKITSYEGASVDGYHDR